MQVRAATRSGKVLLVDDNAYLTDLLRIVLEREGFTVQIATRLAEALRTVAIDPPDVAVIEAVLPDGNGYQACTYLRVQMGIPVVMLSDSHAEDDVVMGLSSGADDYVAKPFSMRILVHRLRAVLKRNQQTPMNGLAVMHRTFRICEATFRPATSEITLGSCSVKLTRTESSLLHLLVTNEWRVLSVDRIMEQLWGYNSETSGSVIKTHISNLRLKLSVLLGPQHLIHTIPSVGYMYRGTPTLIQAMGHIESTQPITVP